MKTKILLIAVALFTNLTFVPAQVNSTIQKKYPKSNIDQFQGKWIGINGNDTLKIFLKKENLEVLKGTDSDVLIGFHQYKKAGQLIESSFDFINTDYKDKHSTLFLSQFESGSAKGAIMDISKGKSLNVELIPDSQQKTLQMKIYEREGFRIVSDKEKLGVTLPKVIKLSRE